MPDPRNLLRHAGSAGLALSLFLSLRSAVRADDPPASFVAQALARPIIGPRQTLAEVQDFTESRVPRMPEVKSADEWTKIATQLRDDVKRRVIFRGEAATWRDATTKVEWLGTIDAGPGYRIKRLRYEAIPGLWIPALLYEPERLDGKRPVILNVNGHDAKGKAADYKQIRCINQAKRGMLALNVEWIGMGQLKSEAFHHGLINALDLCGSSGIAIHYLAMARGLDLLLAHEHADPARVAVTGLSGGGWQTIFISPLDERVTLTDPVAGYSSFLTRARYLSDLGDSEQTPSDLATVVDYAHLTAMMAPKPTLLTFNGKDNCCFAAPHALPPLLEAATPIFRLFGKEANLRSHVNQDPGDHNYGLDNRQALYRMLGDHFYAGDTAYSATEIPSDSEVKTYQELEVELPADNLDLRQIATRLAASLPRDAALPGEKAAAERWLKDRRLRLRALVRPFDEQINVEHSGADEREGTKVSFEKLHLARTWTVPAVDLIRGTPSKGTALLLADAGRAATTERTEALLKDGYRVVALDPFYFGEAQVAERAYLYGLLVSAVGERPLGLQAGQVMAAARWAKTLHKDEPVRVVTVGPRTGLIGVVAAALEPEAIASLTLVDPPGSLKEVIEQGVVYENRPEWFGFGLLEQFDVPQLAALVAPRPVQVEQPGERARKELAPLAAWYATLGAPAEAAPLGR